MMIGNLIILKYQIGKILQLKYFIEIILEFSITELQMLNSMDILSLNQRNLVEKMAIYIPSLA